MPAVAAQRRRRAARAAGGRRGCRSAPRRRAGSRRRLGCMWIVRWPSTCESGRPVAVNVSSCARDLAPQLRADAGGEEVAHAGPDGIVAEAAVRIDEQWNRGRRRGAWPCTARGAARRRGSGCRARARPLPRTAAPFTIRLVSVRMPSRCARRMPALTPGDMPKSSAATMRRGGALTSLRRALAGLMAGEDDQADHRPASARAGAARCRAPGPWRDRGRGC